MFSALTAESLYMRYVSYRKPSKEEIRAILESEDEIDVVATPYGNEQEIVAQARCILLNSPATAELAVVVHDNWQNQRLGTALVQAIVDLASKAGVRRIVGVIGLSNDRMVHVLRELGFATYDACYDTVKMSLALDRDGVQEMYSRYGWKWTVLAYVAAEVLQHGGRLPGDFPRDLRAARARIESGCHSLCEINADLRDLETRLFGVVLDVSQGVAHAMLELIGKAMNGTLDQTDIELSPVRAMLAECGIPRGCSG
jgi:GNAT superfamily N-acetyltransferase